MNNINIYFIGNLKSTEIGDVFSSNIRLPHTLIKFKHPEEFSAYLRGKVSNAYEIGVVLCDLSIAKNRCLSLYDEYMDSYCDGFLKFIFIDNQLNATEISELIKMGVTAVLSKNFSEKSVT